MQVNGTKDPAWWRVLMRFFFGGRTKVGRVVEQSERGRRAAS